MWKKAGRFFMVLVAAALAMSGCMKVTAGEQEAVDVAILHTRPIGYSAADLLRADDCTALHVGVQYMEGFAPDPEALQHLHIFLNNYLNKPDGIFIEAKQINAAADTVLTTKEVLALERNSRTVYSQGKVLGLYLLYTNGTYINEKIVGLAYQNTSAVLFGNMLRAHSGRIGQPDRTTLETTVLLHEVGHLLGLINKGTEMQTAHQDETHASHCSNKNCLMYYRIGTDDRFGYLVRGKVPELDAHCQADLLAHGGKKAQ